MLDAPAPLHIRGYQSYVVLTLCRMLYTLYTGSVATKPVAARWALATLDARWAPLIERAWEGRHNSDAEQAAAGAGWAPLIERASEGPPLDRAHRDVVTASQHLAVNDRIYGMVGRALFGKADRRPHDLRSPALASIDAHAHRRSGHRARRPGARRPPGVAGRSTATSCSSSRSPGRRDDPADPLLSGLLPDGALRGPGPGRALPWAGEIHELDAQPRRPRHARHRASIAAGCSSWPTSATCGSHRPAAGLALRRLGHPRGGA